MNEETINKIKGSKQCYGCELCKEACPVGAISFADDEEGFFSPVIDQEICITCGRCFASCIAQNHVINNSLQEDKYYYGYCKDDAALRKSASGGAAYELYLLALNLLNAVVYGVHYNKQTFLPEYKRVDSARELVELQGTKYAQARKGELYVNVLKDLENGRNVLFIGTPCEVAALKRFLKRDYDGLCCVQLICMGTTSPGLYMKFIQDKVSGEIEEIRERYKRKFWGVPFVFIKEKNGMDYLKPFDLSEYSFLFKWVGRNSCYHCEYKGEKRVGDITIGDFWGAKYYISSVHDGGMSIISTHSKKGEELVKGLGWTELKSYDLSKFNQFVNAVRKYNDKRENVIKQLKEGKTLNDVIWNNATGKEKIRFICSKVIPDWLYETIANR